MDSSKTTEIEPTMADKYMITKLNLNLDIYIHF